MKKIYIIHGWTYSIDKYTAFNSALRLKGFEPVVLKIPGLTGKLDIEKILTLDDYIKWLKQIINNERNKVILIGHSNGGRIALNFTIKYPQKVSNLILMNSAGIYHNELYIQMKRLFFATLAKVGKGITKSQTLRNLLYKFTRENDYKNASSHMGKTMINFIKSDIVLDLNKVSVPTLIIWGENDSVLPLKDGKKMHELIKNSILEIIKGARHSPQFTHPKEVAELIQQFNNKTI